MVMITVNPMMKVMTMKINELITKIITLLLNCGVIKIIIIEIIKILTITIMIIIVIIIIINSNLKDIMNMI